MSATLHSVVALDSFRLSLEWFWNPDHLPFLVAEQQHIFEANSLNVSIIEPDDHFDPLAQLESGALDAAVTETIHLAQDVLKGSSAPAPLVVGFNRFLHTLGGVMYPKAGGRLGKIERPRDLCRPNGQLRIQYPGAPGKGGIAIVKTMVEFDGGSCDETEIVPVNEGFYHTQALLDDKADVATLIFANFELPEARSKDLAVDFFDLKKYGVPDFCQLVLIGNSEAVPTDSRFRRLNRALRDAIDWIKLHPQEAKKLWYAKFPEQAGDVMDEILDRTLYMFPHQQDLSPEYWSGLEAWLRETEQIPDQAGDNRAQTPRSLPAYWTNALAFEAPSWRKHRTEL